MSVYVLHFLKLSQPLKNGGWKATFLLGRPIFRCFVSFGGVHIYMSIYIYTVYIYMFVCVPVFLNISATFRHIQPLSTQNHPRFPDASHHGGMTLRGKVPWLVHGDVYLVHSPSSEREPFFFGDGMGAYLYIYIYIYLCLFIHLYLYIYYIYSLYIFICLSIYCFIYLSMYFVNILYTYTPPKKMKVDCF